MECASCRKDFNSEAMVEGFCPGCYHLAMNAMKMLIDEGLLEVLESDEHGPKRVRLTKFGREQALHELTDEEYGPKQ